MTNISHSWSLVWSKRRRKLTDISFVFFWRALFLLTKITDVDWWNVHGDVVLLRYQWEISPLRFKEIFFLFHSSLKNGLLAIWKCTVIGNIRVTKTQNGRLVSLFSAHLWGLLACTNGRYMTFSRRVILFSIDRFTMYIPHLLV